MLRATYLLIALAMGAQIWPLIVNHPANVEHMLVIRPFKGPAVSTPLVAVSREGRGSVALEGFLRHVDRCKA